MSESRLKEIQNYVDDWFRHNLRNTRKGIRDVMPDIVFLLETVEELQTENQSLKEQISQ